MHHVLPIATIDFGKHKQGESKASDLYAWKAYPHNSKAGTHKRSNDDSFFARGEVNRIVKEGSAKTMSGFGLRMSVRGARRLLPMAAGPTK